MTKFRKKLSRVTEDSPYCFYLSATFNWKSIYVAYFIKRGCHFTLCNFDACHIQVLFLPNMQNYGLKIMLNVPTWWHNRSKFDFFKAVALGGVYFQKSFVRHSKIMSRASLKSPKRLNFCPTFLSLGSNHT